MPKSVLVVDDSQVVRKVMSQFFQSLEDWEVGGEAADGVQAIQKGTELKPDLILLDVSMPKLNGLEAASVLRKALPGVHIILFTMFDDAVGPRLASASGVDLVVPKAAGLTALVKSVQHLMGTTGLIKANAKANRQEPSAAEQS